jgi:hypothetical protein
MKRSQSICSASVSIHDFNLTSAFTHGTLVVLLQRPLSALEKLYIAENRAQTGGDDLDFSRLKKRQRMESSTSAVPDSAAAAKAGRDCVHGGVNDTSGSGAGMASDNAATSSGETKNTLRFVPIALRRPMHETRRQ